MRQRLLLILMSLSLVLLTETPLHAQLAESLTKLSESISRLPEYVLPETPEQRNVVVVSANRMQTDIVAIRRNAGNRKVSSGFVKSLDLDNEAVVSLPRSPNPASRIEVILAVAGDIGVKAGYVQSVQGDIEDIAVNAFTRAGSVAQNGYEVWFVPAALAGNPSRYDRFQNLSSPTERLLPAGNYVMWSQQGTAKGDRKPVGVGTGPRRQTSVDLPVPASAGRGR